jgi:hypothetical protein
VTRLAHRLRLQAEQCRLAGSPLTGALLEGASRDLARGGVVANLLHAHVDEPSGSVPSLRLAGALHRLVLERKALELALHYPSVGGTAPVEDVWPAAERACHEHLEELQHLVRLPVQTNEVGRAAALYGALCLLPPGPVRLLELGASAGLNLRCDAFAYDVAEGVVLGAPDSPVRLVRPWQGTHPARGRVQVLERRGCDPAPVDPATTDGRLTLTSYVWADQLPRLERLRGALQVAERVPSPVEGAGALEFLTRELADLPEDVTTVVWHSVVWQYVDRAERAAVDALLTRTGEAVTSRTPLARISLEPARVGGGDYTFRLLVQRWPTGEQVHVADALGHGPPVRWTGATITP